MTYKEVVDRIEQAVNNHVMLADFGYGQLSDIKVLDEDGDGANYPYAFLNPAGVARNQQASTYSFNLIMMEMALTPRDVLQIQSDCIQYLNDIISELRFDSTFAPDVQLTNSIQVFKERFQDEVAGATATFNIVVADPINNCVAPIETLVETLTPSYDIKSYNSPSASTRQAFIRWEIPEAQKTYRIRGFVEFDLLEVLDIPATGKYSRPRLVVMQDADDPRYLAEVPFTNEIEDGKRVEFDVVYTLQDVAPDNNDLFINFGYTSVNATYPNSSDPIVANPDSIRPILSECKIYEVN